MKLNLELSARNFPDDTLMIGGTAVQITPPLDEDYWLFRVKVSKNQAIVGFPKLFTIGIGFAKETDWNTNLPYSSEAERIFDHIRHNKGRGPKDAECVQAIRMIQDAVKAAKTEGKL